MNDLLTKDCLKHALDKAEMRLTLRFAGMMFFFVVAVLYLVKF